VLVVADCSESDVGCDVSLQLDDDESDDADETVEAAI